MNRPNIESIRARAEQYQDPCAVEGDLCATMAAAATSYRWDIPTLLDYVKELETAARRGHIKPTHGSCCICQRCGRDYDDCRCDLDDTVDENEKLKAKNAELEVDNAKLSKFRSLCLKIGRVETYWRHNVKSDKEAMFDIHELFNEHYDSLADPRRAAELVDHKLKDGE